MTQKGSLSTTTGSVARRLDFHRHGRATACLGMVVALLSLAPLWVCADEVDMLNGDRYVGSVVSLSTDTLVLRNEVLGTVQLPRSKVAHIRLGAGPLAGVAARPSSMIPQAQPPAAAGSAAGTNALAAFPQLGAHTNMIRQIQKQFLAGAGPEANQKFDELLSGLMSGKLTVDDLRAQAQSAADQLRAMKRDGGQEAGFATDSYLAILDQFLKETAPSASATNGPALSPSAKPGQAQPGD